MGEREGGEEREKWTVENAGLISPPPPPPPPPPPHLQQPVSLSSSVRTNRHIRSELKLLEFCSEWQVKVKLSLTGHLEGQEKQVLITCMMQLWLFDGVCFRKDKEEMREVGRR